MELRLQSAFHLAIFSLVVSAIVEAHTIPTSKQCDVTLCPPGVDCDNVAAKCHNIIHNSLVESETLDIPTNLELSQGIPTHNRNERAERQKSRSPEQPSQAQNFDLITDNYDDQRDNDDTDNDDLNDSRNRPYNGDRPSSPTDYFRNKRGIIIYPGDPYPYGYQPSNYYYGNPRPSNYYYGNPRPSNFYYGISPRSNYYYGTPSNGRLVTIIRVQNVGRRNSPGHWDADDCNFIDERSIDRDYNSDDERSVESDYNSDDETPIDRDVELIDENLRKRHGNKKPDRIVKSRYRHNRIYRFRRNSNINSATKISSMLDSKKYISQTSDDSEDPLEKSRNELLQDL